MKQQLRSALVAAQWRGGHRLDTSIVLAAVHGLSGLFRAVFAVEPSLFRPLPLPPPPPPPPSPSLISHLASVDVKHQSISHTALFLSSADPSPSHRDTESPNVDQSWWQQGFMAAASCTSSTAACPTPRWPWRAATGQPTTVTPAVTRRPAWTAGAGTGRRRRRHCRRSGGAGGGPWCRR